MSQKPKIVLLGAGYGGIVTAIRLQKLMNVNEAEVTLINKHDYHYITTHLHMPAAGTDNPENARVDIAQLIQKARVKFVKGTATEIVTDQQVITMEDETEIPYDYLVVGLGGEPETFGIAGLKEYAMNIRSINSVRHIKEHIEYQFAKFKQEPDRLEHLTFVIGGAGFTGIEFLGELADRIPKLCQQFDVDPATVKIYNIEAAPSALPGFDPKLIEYAMNVLEQKGVTFKIGIAIKECTKDSVILADDEEIKSSTIIWTGGIRGNRLLDQAGLETMRGRVKVRKTLQSPELDNVFIIGDCSLIINEESNRPYPPTAQIAMQQAYSTAYNLTALIRNEKLKEFTPDIKGTVASLGKNEAVGVVGNFKIKGYLASLMKKLIDLRYLYVIGGLGLVLRKGKF